MKSLDALARLKALKVPVVSTSEAAAVLSVSAPQATRTLQQLARTGLVVRLRAGLWWIGETPDVLALPEFLSAPYPAYVSLQTALYRRGLISQIPEVTYAVSLSPTFRVNTTAGVVSIHRMAPEVFGGFEVLDGRVKLATAEKALFDVAYLSGSRTRLFSALPELELPRAFDTGALLGWVDRIRTPKMRTQVEGWITRQPALRERVNRARRRRQRR